MSGLFGQRVSLGQANGPDVELVVTGTELYATYETVDGYPAIYDDQLGIFCYATLNAGRFESTGVPVTGSPPAGVQRHAEESAEVRTAKIDARQSLKERRAHSHQAKE